MAAEEGLQVGVSELKVELLERDNWFGMSGLDSAKDPTRGTRMVEFYMDSGACHHMTWNGDILKAYHAHLKVEPPIYSATGGISKLSLAVGGIGYIESKGGWLDHVLFVPDSTVNLVSVSQLTDHYSVKVVFDRDEFWIKMLESKKIIGHGRRVHNKYVVTVLDVGALSDWVLDSSAMMHHTPNRPMLYDFHEKAEDLGADQPEILGHGSIRTERFKVPGVRYIPGNARNIISVAQLADDHGLVTIFHRRICYVKHQDSGQIVGHGHLRDGVYVLHSLELPNQDKVAQGGGGGGGGDDAGDSSSEEKGVIDGGNGGPGDGRAGGDGKGDGGGGQDDGKGGGEENKGKSEYGRNIYYVKSTLDQHLTPEMQLLNSFMEMTDTMIPEYKKIWTVKVGLSDLHVSGIGNIKTSISMNTTIELEDVLLVPRVDQNYVSASKLVDQIVTQVKGQLLWKEQDLRQHGHQEILTHVPQGQLWFERVALPLQGMGVLRLVIDELACQIGDYCVRGIMQQAAGSDPHALAGEESRVIKRLASLIQDMRVPDTWIHKTAGLLEMQNELHCAAAGMGLQKHQIDKLTRFQHMGRQQLTNLLDELRDIGLPGPSAMSLVRMLQDLGDPLVPVSTFAYQLRHWGVPPDLIEELDRQLKTFHPAPHTWIDVIGDKIDCAVPLGRPGPFKITVGKFVQVGHGTRQRGSGLYRILQLGPCPPVRLSFCWDEPSELDKWALKLC